MGRCSEPAALETTAAGTVASRELYEMAAPADPERGPAWAAVADTYIEIAAAYARFEDAVQLLPTLRLQTKPKEDDSMHAVLREADDENGEPDAVFTERETALLVAAVYPTMGREQQFQITTAEGGVGADVNALVSGKLEKAGWLRHMHPELVKALNVVEWLLLGSCGRWVSIRASY
jgi:hypothetical protein